MAKTIEQIQDMITIGGDVRQVVNEIADYLEANPPVEGADPVVGFPDGMKIYTALLTQSGTNAPVATVLQNTIGAIVWTRFNTGTYRGTLTNAFTASKTLGFVSEQGDISPIAVTSVGARRTSSSIFEIRTAQAGALADDAMINTPIEIRVYL